jgi:phosphotransferase system IIA component
VAKREYYNGKFNIRRWNMKHGKKLTREQKKFLSSKGYQVVCYLVVKNTSEELVILNKETGQTETVRR